MPLREFGHLGLDIRHVLGGDDMQVIERGLMNLHVGGRGRKSDLLKQERDLLQRVCDPREIGSELQQSHFMENLDSGFDPTTSTISRLIE